MAARQGQHRVGAPACHPARVRPAPELPSDEGWLGLRLAATSGLSVHTTRCLRHDQKVPGKMSV